MVHHLSWWIILLILITIFPLCFQDRSSAGVLFVHGKVPVSSFTGRESYSKAVVRRRHKPRCSDRKDNDHDGLIDYPSDPGCRSRRDNSEYNRRRRPTATPTPSMKPELGAGASLHGWRPFPADNPWNRDISKEPVDPDSNALIAAIGAETGLHPDFGTVWEGAPIGIPYIVVPGNQRKIFISSFWYPDESDAGPYPIPGNPPVEGGADGNGDRHVLIIDRDNWKLYELYAALPDGSGGWSAGSGAIFDLNSNALRPAGWTSADAAGLPIFPGLVRYDEVYEKGEIRHALRFTVERTRKAYVSPARHWASSLTGSNLPPMGMRVRLKSSFDVSPYPRPVQVILKALKKYGMMVADNGSDWFITGAPDSRWNDEELSTIRGVKGNSFEVVKMTNITAP